MSGIPFWQGSDDGGAPDLSFWDTLFLGGVIVPGLCASFDVEKARTIDVAKQKGKDGITLTDNGYDGAPIKATQMLWLPVQWNDFQDWLPNYDPERPGGQRTPLDIFHPAASLLGITSVYLKKIHIAQPVKGILKVDFEMIQWFTSTKSANSKPTPKGFDGTNSKTGAPLNAKDFSVPSPSADTGSKL